MRDRFKFLRRPAKEAAALTPKRTGQPSKKRRQLNVEGDSNETEVLDSDLDNLRAECLK